MNCGDKSLAGIFSAKQLARTDEMCRALERAAQAENERKRKVGARGDAQCQSLVVELAAGVDLDSLLDHLARSEHH